MNDRAPIEMYGVIVEYWPRVKKRALHLMKNVADAEDLTQETMANAIEHWGYYKPGFIWPFLLRELKWTYGHFWQERSAIKRGGNGRIANHVSVQMVTFDETHGPAIGQQQEWRVLFYEVANLLMTRHRGGKELLLNAMGHGNADIARRIGAKPATVDERIMSARKRIRDFGA